MYSKNVDQRASKLRIDFGFFVLYERAAGPTALKARVERVSLQVKRNCPFKSYLFSNCFRSKEQRDTKEVIASGAVMSASLS
eukprot:4637882-Pleurochrysis_carterae.AAC.2